MARRRGPGRWTEAQVWELGPGRFLTGVVPDRSCTRPQWCPRCSTGWRCWSNFESEEQARDCYWANRDEIMAQDGAYGRRSWSFWRFEALGLCRCDEPCGDARVTMTGSLTGSTGTTP